MAFHAKLYLSMLATFLAIDAVWLGLVARGFYRDQIGFLLAPEPDWLAALVFYLLFVAGIQTFVVVPGLRHDSPRRRLMIRAAFFGVVTYATYDLTNLATVAGWPVLVTVVDLIWGAVLSTAVSLVGHAVGRRLAEEKTAER